MSDKDQGSQILTEVYKEVCTNIRTTDDISFKLLGAIPAVSAIGSGVLTDLAKGFPAFAIIGISALGAVITFGLFMWELRNIQKCLWLISRAAGIEQRLFADAGPPLQFDGMAKPKDVAARQVDDITLKSLSTLPWGKTQASKLIYGASVIAWLVPIAIAISTLVCRSLPTPG